MKSISVSMVLKTEEGILKSPEHSVAIQDIGKEVKVLRNYLKLTKTRLSEKSGLSRSQLWAIEQGNEVPRVETLLQILDSVSHAIEVHVGSTVALYDDDMGERLIALRKQSGITQTELASRAGIYQPHLSTIEQGKHLPRLDTLMSLLDALEAPLKIRVVPC